MLTSTRSEREMAVAQWTLTQVIQQLNGGQRWAGNTITYAFPTNTSGIFSQGEAQGFRPVNATQQALLTLALQTWDELIPQNMQPGTPGATNIEFGYTNTNIGFAHAYFPQIGSTWFNSTESDLTSPAFGAYGFLTFVHEIGHALGLNHMGDYNGNGNWTPSSYQDSIVLSVMSYFGPRNAAAQYSPEVAQADWVDAQGRVHEPQTPMVNDIAAIQFIYGSSATTRTDNTTYGFRSNITGSAAQIYDFTRNRDPILTIFDSGGNDTLDLSGWFTPSRIDLRPGAYSNANSMTNNIAIALSTVIENAVGGGGADVLIGNSVANRLEGGGGDDELQGLEGNDVLIGGPGNDTLDGGAGDDDAVFTLSFASYAINVAGASVTISGGGSTARVSNVERFVFADVTRLLTELTRGDTSAPAVATLSPADNASDVPGQSNLIIGFDEPVKAGTGNVSIFTGTGNLVVAIAATDANLVRIDGTRVVIDPPPNLSPGSYYVNIAAGAFTDLAGNPYAGIANNQGWNFTVVGGDTVAPRLLSFTPADEASSVTPSSNLVLVFDENVQRGVGSITLRDAGGTVVRSISAADAAQVSIDGATVTVNPSTDLPAATTFTVTIDPGAFRDAAGNGFGGLASTTAWNFSTAAQAGDDYPATSATTGVVTVGGAPATGVIETADDFDAFKVNLTAGLTYTFTLQRAPGGLTDPLLGLFGPNESLIVQDDDSGGSGNSRIVYTAQVSGTHYLLATDYGNGTGAYTVSASVQDSGAPTLLARAPADDATGVAASANLTLTFSEPVVAGGGSIRLLNAAGALLREIPANDTRQVTINGATVTVNPDADLLLNTTYVVNVDTNAFRDTSGNNFAGIGGLTAWNFTTAAPTANDDFPMNVNTPGIVVPGGPAVDARIDGAADGDLFRVNLTAGVTYQLEMNAPPTSPVDPYLMLYGLLPAVELIGFDDDSAGNFNARLFFTPAESGTYYMAAFDYADATGIYSVRAAVPTDDYLGSTATTGRLTVGGLPARGEIGVPADVDSFAVTLTAGEQYTFDLVRLSVGGLEDPYLVLSGPDGRAITYDDDSGATLNSRITFTPPTSGTYYLSASDFDDGTGAYQLFAVRRNILEGTNGNDSITGTIGADTLNGRGGNDTLIGTGGDDVIDGGPGIDVAAYFGSASRFEIFSVEGGWLLRDTTGGEGIDNLSGIERLHFGDLWWAVDLDGNAGTTVKILGAVFGPSSVENTDFVGIGLWALDGGVSYPDLMRVALEARLGANPNNTDVVNLLYRNLVGIEPPREDFLYYVGLLTSGQLTQVQLAQLAAEHPVNLQNIGFDQLVDFGIPFNPFVG
jgi:methionine-rich copper-binding protein CopC